MDGNYTYSGNKYIIFTTGNVFGRKSTTLIIVYLIVGIIYIILFTVLFVLNKLKKPAYS